MVYSNVVDTIMILLLCLFAAARLYRLHKSDDLNIATVFDISLETIALALLLRVVKDVLWR